MDYYCEVCEIFIKPKSRKSHFISKSHTELDSSKHMKLLPKGMDINNVDKTFFEYIIEYNKKFDYYPIKCQFAFVFNDYLFCPYVTSNISDNKTLISWSNLLEKLFSDFKEKDILSIRL